MPTTGYASSKFLRQVMQVGLDMFLLLSSACGSKDQAETTRGLPLPAVVVA